MRNLPQNEHIKQSYRDTYRQSHNRHSNYRNLQVLRNMSNCPQDTNIKVIHCVILRLKHEYITHDKLQLITKVNPTIMDGSPFPITTFSNLKRPTSILLINSNIIHLIPTIKNVFKFNRYILHIIRYKRSYILETTK